MTQQHSGALPRIARLWAAGLVVGACAWPWWAAAQGATEPTVTLHYVPRPPYMMAKDDGLVGLTGGPSHEAFKLANVPVRLADTPFARQLRTVRDNTGMDCMIGMFWKAEREAFGRYSKPVYQDQPQVILAASSKAERFQKHGSVEDVFKDRSLRLLVKLAYSYGAPLDALIDQLQPNRRATPDENLRMLRQIHMGMADYMLIAPEEAAAAIQAAGFQPSDFAQIRYRSMPAGERRHLFCSLKVPEAVMRRLDAAIVKITAATPTR
jgi:polar amino acid transport system substrate-binding protein